MTDKNYRSNKQDTKIKKIVRTILFTLSAGFLILASATLSSGLKAESATRLFGAVFFGVVAVWLVAVYPLIKDSLN